MISSNIHETITSYAVEWAPDGEGGLEKHRASKADLIVLDLNPTDIDGLDVCKQIRSGDSGNDHTLKLGPFSIADRAQDSVVKFAPAAERRGIELVLMNPEDVPRVVGDIAMIARALANIIDNSLNSTLRRRPYPNQPSLRATRGWWCASRTRMRHLSCRSGTGEAAILPHASKSSRQRHWVRPGPGHCRGNCHQARIGLASCKSTVNSVLAPLFRLH